MKRRRIVLHLWRGDTSRSVLGGITVGSKTYSIGELFTDDNVANTIGYIGPPDKLGSRLLATILLCAIDGRVPLERLAELGIWTATGRVIHRDLTASFVDGRCGRLIHVSGTRANAQTSSAYLADDVDVVFDTDLLARDYVQQLSSDAEFSAGASADRDEDEHSLLLVPGPHEEEGGLMSFVEAWGFRTFDGVAAASDSWLNRVNGAAGLVVELARPLAPPELLAIGYARGTKVAIVLVANDNEAVLDKVLYPFDAHLYHLESIALVKRLHRLVVPPEAYPAVCGITSLVAKALHDHKAPEPLEPLPDRITLQKTVAAATQKQQEYGRKLLEIGRGMPRFLNLFTRYADRDYGPPMIGLIDRARRQRASLATIVRAIVLAQP